MIGFGGALRRFRADRGLSLRELGTLCDLNYAYIHRLEDGEKTAPSEDAIEALCQALKLSAQRRRLLRSLLTLPPVPDALFEAMLQHPVATVDAFGIAAKASFRGARPTTPADWIAKLDDLDVNVLQNRTR